MTELRGNARWLAVALACGTVAALLEGATFGLILAALKVVGENKDAAITTFAYVGTHVAAWARAQTQTFLFLALIVAAVTMQVVRSIIVYVGSFTGIHVATHMQRSVQQRAYRHILGMTYEGAMSHNVGDLTDMVVSPSTAISEMVQYANELITNSLIIVGYAALLVAISPTLTAAALLLFGAIAFAQKQVVARIRDLSVAFSQGGARLSKQVVESLQALRIIHTFNGQNTAVHQFNSMSDYLVDLNRGIGRSMALLGPLSETLTIIAVGGFLVLGVLTLDTSHSSALPELLTFTAIVNRLAGRANGIPQLGAQIAKRTGQLARLNDLLTVDHGRQHDISAATVPGVHRELAFENISFRYRGVDSDALANATFRVAVGSVTAIVGGSGAGKSTLVDLLLRLYEPTEGNITVDGEPLTTYSRASWRKHLGVVGQDTFLFNDTISANISYGRPDATETDVRRAATIANAHEFIMSLPNGYDTIVGERGYGLSGGQRQRIALARAVVREPQILILDEATSALDSESERLIQDAIATFAEGRTVFIIAHRLSTILHADQILLMSDGAIAEVGTHAELLASGGKYARYWQLQTDSKEAKDCGA